MYRPTAGERVELINDFTGSRVGFGVVQFADPDLDERFVIVKDGEQRARFFCPEQLKRIVDVRESANAH
ncbi:MAG: hypothetical protein ABI809_10355 [Caldimonas sp.]